LVDEVGVAGEPGALFEISFETSFEISSGTDLSGLVHRVIPQIDETQPLRLQQLSRNGFGAATADVANR
jgi:hypothetical protein